MDLRQLFGELLLIDLALGYGIKNVHIRDPRHGDDEKSHILFNTADRRIYGKVLRYFRIHRHFKTWRGTRYPLWVPPMLFIYFHPLEVPYGRFRRHIVEASRTDKRPMEGLLDALAFEIRKG